MRKVFLMTLLIGFCSTLFSQDFNLSFSNFFNANESVVKPERAEYGIDLKGAITLRNVILPEDAKLKFDTFYKDGVLAYLVSLEKFYLNQNILIQNENARLNELLKEDAVKYSELEARYNKAQDIVNTIESNNNDIDTIHKELKRKKAVDIVKIGGIGFAIGVVVAVPITIWAVNKIKD